MTLFVRFVMIALAFSSYASEAARSLPYATYKATSRELEASLLRRASNERTVDGSGIIRICGLNETSYSQLTYGRYKDGFGSSVGIHPYVFRSPTFAALVGGLYRFEQQRHDSLMHLACPTLISHNYHHIERCAASTSSTPCRIIPASQAWHRQNLQKTKHRMSIIERLVLYENRRYFPRYLPRNS